METGRKGNAEFCFSSALFISSQDNLPRLAMIRGAAQRRKRETQTIIFKLFLFLYLSASKFSEPPSIFTRPQDFIHVIQLLKKTLLKL